MIESATITWIYYKNYGTYLQAYALQRVVEDMGVNNTIIYDKGFLLENSIKRSRKSKLILDLKKLIINVLQYFKGIRKDFKSKNDFFYRCFADKYLSIDYDSDSFEKIDLKYDLFFCGSDQIWSFYASYNPYFYLAFTHKPKIAYAPSTGTGVCSDEYKKNVKLALEDFSFLSVREMDGKNMLSSFVNKEIEVVLDPTLLLKREKWSQILVPVSYDNYIICYLLSYNEAYLNYARKMAKKCQSKLFIFATDNRYVRYADELIIGGPSEFLSYISKAKFVLTDSFHATIFSILFEKDFLIFKRFVDGEKGDQNARIRNLLLLLHIEGRFLGEDDLLMFDESVHIDYHCCNKYMDYYRQFSLRYLERSINSVLKEKVE